MQIISANGNMIDTKVQFHQDSELMYITWIHANTDDIRISQKWAALRRIGRCRTGMWVCQCDFNAITHHREKEGGRRKPQR